MEKIFTLAMPNQPLVTDSSDGNTVEITYYGPRYLVVSTKDNVLRCVEGRSESLADINLAEYEDDVTDFHVLDADKHPAIAAWLTEQYTNAEVADYEEILPSGEVYGYPYTDTGIIDLIWDGSDFTYNSATDTYSDPVFRTTITQEQFDTSIALHKEWIASVDTSTLTEAQATAFTTYCDWYDTFETVYAGVDYWKIPLPVRPRI